MAHFEVPEASLKQKGTHRPQRQNGSRKNRGKGVPVVEEDTAKVLEMYLKRHQPLSQGTEAPTEEPTKVKKDSGDNQAEREEYFKHIADRLARIGDQVLEDYDIRDIDLDTLTIVTEAGPAQDVSRGANYEEIGKKIQTDLDDMHLVDFTSKAAILNGVARYVIKKATYKSFCSGIEFIVGQDVGLSQLAIVFKFTQVALMAAPSMSQNASRIKDYSVRFISDRFAVWLDSQGGWGSVVTTDDSDFEEEREERMRKKKEERRKKEEQRSQAMMNNRSKVYVPAGFMLGSDFGNLNK